ncbi:succinyltransferase-like protein [Motilibacter peucedani]|uniref:Succinyltransferase-like protein n=1 Tax=Motilibacter peucedani TaxID=598650 RepID=A0A420XV18_9ACTN|nr:acyltransferase [Motilibacter peucedani]RKS80590.1 succinyltransferase-like protein [Motilibacter peucedani]
MSISVSALQAATRTRGALLRRRVEGGEDLRAERGVRIVRLGGGTAVRVGPGVLLAHHVGLHLRDAGAVIEIGGGTFVNHRTEIVAHERVSIGRGCLLAWDVLVVDSDSHSVDGAPRTSPVVIGDRVWVGARATVLKGVTVGEGAVVAAGAVVTRDVPARALVGGNPARVLREEVTWEE